MSVVVNWVDQSKEIECSCIDVPVKVGNLFVCHAGNVIKKTEWSLQFSKTSSLPKDELCVQIQQYLNNPKKSLVVGLQKQGTDFRNKVWAEICRIPVGQVVSYSDLAKTVGSGARAVANACRDNPFPGIIPCHRVVAISGLGGYMGETSGNFMEIKKKLLEMEEKFLL